MIFNTRATKIYRDITTRKAQTALVSISIFIGVLGVVTLFSLGTILTRQLESAIDQDRLAMINAYVALKSGHEAGDAGFLDTLRALPGVRQVQALALYPAYWKLPDEAGFTEGRIFSYPTPPDAIALEPPELIGGRWPASGLHEIAVERRFASEHHVKPGDTLVLHMLGTGPTPQDVAWTITGTFFQPYQYPVLPGSSATIPGRTMLFATPDDAAQITGLDGFSLIQARYADFATADAQSSAFEAAINQSSPYVPYITLTEDPAKNSLVEQTHIFDSVLQLLALVALVVSGFLVLNVISAMVLEQRRQIGVMKALGATDRDHFVMYTGIALVYGLIGVVPGVLLGIPSGFSSARTVAREINVFVDQFMTSTTAIVIGAALGIVIPVAAAVPPVLSGVRVTILEAITDRGIQRAYGRGPLARAVDAVPMPISARQSMRNVLQKKGRLAMTVTTLALAAGAFMGVYAAMASFRGIVTNVTNQIGIDITVNPRGTQDFEMVRDLIRSNVAGIRAIEPGVTLAIDIDGYTPVRQPGGGPSFMIASGINPLNPAVVNFELRSGRGWRDDPTRRGVVISASIADGMHITTGDSITIYVSGKSETFDVIGVSTYAFDTVWMRWQDLAQLGGLTKNAPVPNQYFTTVDVNDQPVTAAGINEQAGRLLSFQAGSYDPAGVIVSTALADRQGYTVGDRLALGSGNHSLTLPVTGIFDIPPQLAAPDRSAEVIALDWQTLAGLEGTPLDGEPVPNGLQIVLDEAHPTAQQVEHKIAAINDVLLAHGINALYTNWPQTMNSLTEMLNTAEAVMNIAASLIGAVGAIGLLSTLSMSVFERLKEIGVMRSIGASSNVIALQFLIEGVIIGVIAWLIGIPLSFALKNALVAALKFQDVPGTDYPPITLLLGLVGMLVIATGASLWPSISAARKTVSDILRYQ